MVFLVPWDGFGAGRGTPNALSVSNGSTGAFKLSTLLVYKLEAPVRFALTGRNFADFRV